MHEDQKRILGFIYVVPGSKRPLEMREISCLTVLLRWSIVPQGQDFPAFLEDFTTSDNTWKLSVSSSLKWAFSPQRGLRWRNMVAIYPTLDGTPCPPPLHPSAPEVQTHAPPFLSPCLLSPRTPRAPTTAPLGSGRESTCPHLHLSFLFIYLFTQSSSLNCR